MHSIFTKIIRLLWISNTVGLISLIGIKVLLIIKSRSRKIGPNDFPIYEDDKNNIWLLDYGWLGVVCYNKKLNTLRTIEIFLMIQTVSRADTNSGYILLIRQTYFGLATG